MNYELLSKAGAQILGLKGRLDAISGPELEEQLDLQAVQTKLIIDFTDLAYISSAGLRVILKLAKLCKHRGKAWCFAGCRLHQEIFDISGFSES
jgi:anti-anti-sigma factor